MDFLRCCMYVTATPREGRPERDEAATVRKKLTKTAINHCPLVKHLRHDTRKLVEYRRLQTVEHATQPFKQSVFLSLSLSLSQFPRWRHNAARPPEISKLTKAQNLLYAQAIASQPTKLRSTCDTATMEAKALL